MKKVPAIFIVITLLSHCSKSNKNSSKNRPGAHQEAASSFLEVRPAPRLSTEEDPVSSSSTGEVIVSSSEMSANLSTSVTNRQSVSAALPLFVLLGGSSSCGNHVLDPTGGTTLNVDMREPFFEMLSTLSVLTGEYPDFVISCYVRNLKRPEGLGAIRVATRQSGPVETIMNETSLSTFIGEYAMGREVFLVGHSYGGWLAMSIARDFVYGVPRSFRPASFIVTIDPISAVDCKHITDSGCRMAPRDFSEEQKNAMRNFSRGWMHFYQRITPVVRSCDILEATEHHHIFKNHFTIDISREVWDDIFERTRNVFLGI